MLAAEVMSTRFHFFVLVAVMLNAAAFADAPSGSLEYNFTTNSVPLWDLTGAYELEQEISGTAGQVILLKFTVVVEHSAKGRLVGEGSTTGMIGDSPVTGDFRVLGRVLSSSDGLVRVKMVARFNGHGMVENVNTSFRIKVRHHFELDGNNRQLIGNARGAAKFSDLTNGPIHGESEAELPDGNDGSWRLGLEIIPVGNLGGTAEIGLVNGRSLLFGLKGHHADGSDTSRLKLSGYGTTKGLNFKLRTAGSAAVIQEVKGKALGQKLRYQAE